MLQLLSCAIIVGCFCQAGSSNVAIDKPASQSSDYASWKDLAANGVDGRYETYFHTASESNPWWRVDLQQPVLITSVVIHNRMDCCADRAKNIKLTIGTSLDAMAEQGYTVGVDSSSGVHVFSFCQPVSGRYVQLQLMGVEGYFHLREVQIFEEDDNIAFGKSASMINNHHGTQYLASAGVDGNIGGDNLADLTACFHTQNVSNPWWRVDLGQSYAVAAVTVYNRQDCCSDRAKGLELAMGNDITNLVQKGHLDGVLESRHTFPLNPAVTARFVQLKLLNVHNYLHLCEIKVLRQ